MIKNGTKKWRVSYAHDDGRSGEVEVQTETQRVEGSKYGNKTYGRLTVNDFHQAYDLRYARGDLHMVMLKEYFGAGLVEAVEL